MPDIFVSPETSSGKTGKPEKKSSILQSLGAYLYEPVGIRFETQEPGETIILLLRAHKVTNIPWIIISVLLLLTPILLFSSVVDLGGVLESVIPLRFLISILVGWYLFTASYILVHFLLWYFNISIVTNRRIIDVDFINILHKELSATTLDKVEDITSNRTGFFGSLFDFGNVIVQTAAAEVEFDFLKVPHPEEVVRILNKLMEETKQKGAKRV